MAHHRIYFECLTQAVSEFFCFDATNDMSSNMSTEMFVAFCEESDLTVKRNGIPIMTWYGARLFFLKHSEFEAARAKHRATVGARKGELSWSEFA